MLIYSVQSLKNNSNERRPKVDFYLDMMEDGNAMFFWKDGNAIFIGRQTGNA